ncbi:MAG: glycosyltransferase family 2 protein, partial [bacterium]|nr:glycosyltransferase family 2 protein [bacterium]
MAHATPLLVLDSGLLLRRVLEIIPGLLVWGTLIGLTILGFTNPLAVAVFLILYDFYWLVRALYVATHLVASYRTLRLMRGVDWLARLRSLDDPRRALATVETRLRDAERTVATASGDARRMAKKTLRQERRFRADLLQLQASGNQRPTNIPRWDDLLHVVILSTYREPLALLQQSLDALGTAAYPKERLWVVVTLEERAGEHAVAVQDALQKRYANSFGRFLTTVHPDGIPGERQVKSANASYAARTVQKLIDAESIPYEHVLISNFDSDTVASPEYFGALTYTYLVTPDRLRCSYQPLPFYHNNLWEAPAFTRVISTNSTFWILIQFAKWERMVTYSSHAMPFRALVDVGFWDPTAVSEDSRIFWQCYAYYEGNYRVVPLYATVSMDVTRAPTLFQTFVHQYKQKRRWAWGIENFPFIVQTFLKRSAIPVKER